MDMSLSQARVIDPVLTAVAQGYKHAERVGSTLFPSVPVMLRGGTVLEFNRDSFRLYFARRSPGANTGNIPFGYSGKTFQLVQDALNATVPRELLQDAKAVPNIDLGQRAVSTTMLSLTLSLEHEQAGIATNPANYDEARQVVLSGSNLWSDPSSNPERDIADAKEEVRMSTGVDPNRMVIGKKVYNALKLHPKIIERFKYTSADSITAGMLASLFDLDMLSVGKAMAIDSSDPAEPFREIWGPVAVLAYAPQAPTGPEEPSFGYTYTLTGHPFVEQSHWDNDRKSWVYGVTYERLPVLTGIASGFLFRNVVEG